jgi:hypothetical protein
MIQPSGFCEVAQIFQSEFVCLCLTYSQGLIITVCLQGFFQLCPLRFNATAFSAVEVQIGIMGMTTAIPIRRAAHGFRCRPKTIGLFFGAQGTSTLLLWLAGELRLPDLCMMCVSGLDVFNCSRVSRSLRFLCVGAR